MTRRDRRSAALLGAAALVSAVAMTTSASGAVAVGRPGPPGSPASDSPAPGSPALGSRPSGDEAAALSGVLQALRANPGALGFDPDGGGSQGIGARDRVHVTDVITDPDGSTHIRMRRTYLGLPVIGGDFVVHRAPSGAWRGVDATLTEPIELAVRTLVSGASATATAVSPGAAPLGVPSLVVDALGPVPRLAWDVMTVGVDAEGTPSRLHTYVDAVTGTVAHRNQTVHTALARPLPDPRGARAGDTDVPPGSSVRRRLVDDGARGLASIGTGRSLYNGSVPLNTTLAGSDYELRDSTRGEGYTADADGRVDQCIPVSVPLCLDTAPRTVFTDEDNTWGSGGPQNAQTAAVDAQYGSNVTWDYFAETFGRYGVAGDGRGVYSRVHYGTDYANAFWNDACQCVTYGDGDGKNIGPLVSLDIAGHEVTHGLTSHTAGLVNVGESGGLNEATSDIFGTMVEFYADNSHDPGDYLLGETAFAKKRGADGRRNATRYMNRPSLDGGSPDCYNPGLGVLGPHLAAGPADHFFYLLAEGSGKTTINGVHYKSPTCNGDEVTGVGREDAARIWYRALTVHMTSASDYEQARAATLAAARSLFGADSTQHRAVATAWSAVGVSGPRG